MKSKSIVRLMFTIAFSIVALQYFLLKDLVFTGTLLLLIPIPFIQNMAFTWVSRSRQGGDPDHHRPASWSSNGVWIITQTFIAANVYTPITHMIEKGLMLDQVLKIFLTFLIYTITTAEGSVFMMKIRLGMIKRLPRIFSFLVEEGATKVGADAKKKQ